MAHDAKRDRCQECGGSFPDPGTLSRNGLCAECGPKRSMDAAAQLKAKSGPYYDRWLARIREGIGA